MKDIFPQVTGIETVFQTDWFCLEKKLVLDQNDQVQPFYSIKEGDHVAVLAEDAAGRVVLIRQYRPALESMIIELPGGHVDNGNASQSALDELYEETGYQARKIVEVGKLAIDSGRNQGYLYAYYASDIEKRGSSEPGIDVMAVEKNEMIKMILKGDFSHALNVCVVLLAILKGHLLFNTK